MLVVIGDLHLTDGSVSATTSPDAFFWFLDQLEHLTEAASWRRDDSYRPVERIHLLLLGDVLDFLASDRWSARSTVRPWTPAAGPGLFAQLSRIAEAILTYNHTAVEVLGHLAREGVAIPPLLRANPAGAGAAEESVPVTIHYMVGDRDWFLHLPDQPFHRLRETVATALGVASPPDSPFPYEPTEDTRLLEVLRRHKVIAEHGDRFDPFAYWRDRNTAAPGDVFIVDLLLPFQRAVADQLSDALPEGLITALAGMYDVNPPVAVPVWLDALLHSACLPRQTRCSIERLWDAAVDKFLRSERIVQWISEGDTRVRSRLGRLLRFASRPARGWRNSILAWHRAVRGVPAASYLGHALREQDFRNRRAKHVVYGHRHVPETRPLEASFADGYVLDQIFHQAAGWRRMYRSTAVNSGHGEWVAHESRQLLVFYQGDECGGRPFETLTATLGCPRDARPHIKPRRSRSELQASQRTDADPSEATPAPHFLADLQGKPATGELPSTQEGTRGSRPPEERHRDSG